MLFLYVEVLDFRGGEVAHLLRNEPKYKWKELLKI